LKSRYFEICPQPGISGDGVLHLRDHRRVHYELRFRTKGKANGDKPANGCTTKGDAKVTLSKEESILRDIASQIGVDEQAHVVLLRGALGSSVPNIDLSALGFDFGNQSDSSERHGFILQEVLIMAAMNVAARNRTHDPTGSHDGRFAGVIWQARIAFL
jgi:hypothetical protein